MNILCLDFSRAFDATSFEICVEKQMHYGLDEQMMSWIPNWLNGQTQKVAFSGTKSGWRLATSREPQGSVCLTICCNVLQGTVPRHPFQPDGSGS